MDTLVIKRYEEKFSICKVIDYSKVNLDEKYVFTGCTHEEKSLVCPSALVPENITEKEDGWKMMKIEGVLDFSLIGILSKISGILAENKIGIFAISTFNTDYIFVKEDFYEQALNALSQKGIQVI